MKLKILPQSELQYTVLFCKILHLARLYSGKHSSCKPFTHVAHILLDLPFSFPCFVLLLHM
jgi:hypothetical protein